MKRLTIDERFEAIMKINGMTPTMSHIAMAIVLGKSWTEMTAMYGRGTLSTSLNRLKKLSVVKNVGYGEWELTSPEMVDEINLVEIPDADAINETIQDISDAVSKAQIESLNVTIGTLIVKVYLNSELSPNDPYVLIEASKPDSLLIVINQSHPHWLQLKDNEVYNYLRHCTYDGVAEWQARNRISRIDPSTIKILKDKLLRVQFIIEDNDTVQEP